MSTNFYADWKISENVTTRLHIGKRTRSGISTFQGSIFPSIEAWKTFLRHNVATVTVVSEYNEPQDTERFITEEIDSVNGASFSQMEWLKNHAYVIHSTPNTQMGSYWADQDYTRLFYNGEFS